MFWSTKLKSIAFISRKHCTGYDARVLSKWASAWRKHGAAFLQLCGTKITCTETTTSWTLSLFHSMRARARKVFVEMTCLAETGTRTTAIAAVGETRRVGRVRSPGAADGGRAAVAPGGGDCGGRRRSARSPTADGGRVALTDAASHRRSPRSIRRPAHPIRRSVRPQPTAAPDSHLLPPPLLSPEPARRHALARSPSHVETMPSCSGRGPPARRAAATSSRWFPSAIRRPPFRPICG
jgi:hypothetical protein